MITNQCPTDIYHTPEEADAVQARQLAELSAVTTSLRLAMFQLSHPPLVEALKTLYGRTQDVKILLDVTEGTTPAEVKMLHNLLSVIPTSCVRLTSSQVHRKFMHDKTAVCDAATVLYGSLNWSTPAFQESNLFCVSRSPELAAAITARFDALWDWALANPEKGSALP